jgi:hypothetical protein
MIDKPVMPQTMEFFDRRDGVSKRIELEGFLVAAT